MVRLAAGSPRLRVRTGFLGRQGAFTCVPVACTAQCLSAPVAQRLLQLPLICAPSNLPFPFSDCCNGTPKDALPIHGRSWMQAGGHTDWNM